MIFSRAKRFSEDGGVSTAKSSLFFIQLDKDSFLEKSFGYIAQFFENSLDKLSEHNPGIQGRFRRIDSRHFSVAIYRDGQDLSRCRIWYDGPQSFTNGIAYSENGKEHLTVNEAAEFLWNLLMRPLQQ